MEQTLVDLEIKNLEWTPFVQSKVNELLEALNRGA
jgi:hypothetical protein